MRMLMWSALGFGAMLWSLLAWFLFAVAGAGSAAVNRMAGLLQIDPAAIQWLADTMDIVGGFAQLLVVLVWLIGFATLGLVGWLGSRALAEAGLAVDGARERRAAGAIDAEVRARTLSDPPRPRTAADRQDPA